MLIIHFIQYTIYTTYDAHYCQQTEIARQKPKVVGVSFIIVIVVIIVIAVIVAVIIFIGLTVI